MIEDIEEELDIIKKLLTAGDMSLARTKLRNISTQYPDSREIWILRASLEIREQNFKDCIEPFCNWIRLDESSAIASSGYVRSCHATGMINEALAEIYRFRKVANPKDSGAQSTLVEHKRTEDLISSK